MDVDTLIDTPFKQSVSTIATDLQAQIDVFVGQLSQSARLILVNGVMDEILSDTSLLPPEIRFSAISNLSYVDAELLESYMYGVA